MTDGWLAADGLTRRHVLRGGLASAGLAAASWTRPAIAAAPRRTLIRNATIITGDRRLGNLPLGHILIEGERIAAIGADIAAADAEQVDGETMIAMPGMIDTHRHLWQGLLRRDFPNVTLDQYFTGVLTAIGPLYRPEDAYLGNLISALSAIDAGITCIVDWSHIQNTPAHTDAVIGALKASGIRAMFGYGPPENGGLPPGQDKKTRFPGDIRRLRTQYFSSEDQLLTLALAPDGPSFGPVEPAIADWTLAREVKARITVHIMGPQTLDNFRIMQARNLLGPDTTYVHCTNLQDEAWRIIHDTGGTVSVCTTVEMQMGHGLPAIQAALDHGIRPSLGVDVETSAPNDLFTQMRAALALQRGMAFAQPKGKTPALITTNDVFQFATYEGARASGLDGKTGTLAPGKQADLVLLRKTDINTIPVPREDPVAAVVLGMDTSNVDSVYVAGKALKRNGRLVGVDVPALAAKAKTAHDDLMQRAAAAKRN